jgi:uncharacterized SAM-binding protein YcdF (DUF218 family)
MKQTTPWMVHMVRIAAVLFVLMGAFLVFVYTPFYSHAVVSILNRVVVIEMNPVAAKSQENAALTDQETLEPGSELWIARQAYLKLLEKSLVQTEANDTQPIKQLRIRYQLLQEKIEQELAQQEQPQPIKVEIPLLNPAIGSSSEATVVASAEQIKALMDLNSEHHQELMQDYTTFLLTFPLEETATSDVDLEAVDEHDIADKGVAHAADAYAIVVLGGGLTLAENGRDIVVNDYTRLRLEKTLEIKKQDDLPIVLSGVEAPYMREWLRQYNVEARLLENRSMNTCENTRFSALLLQKKGGAPKVILITDRYHMPRTRRLFALNGIETIPVEAPMPTALTAWQPHAQNYHHSRRANYEILASLRDIWFGSSDCREVP